MVEAAFKSRKHEFVRPGTRAYVRTEAGSEVVVLLQAERQCPRTDRSWWRLEIFGPALEASRQRHPYRQLHEANNQSRDTAVPRAHPRADAGQPSLSGRWLRRQSGQRFQKEIPRHRRPMILKNPLGVILGTHRKC